MDKTKKERLSTINDKMELLSSDDARSIYFDEEKPEDIYADILSEQDITDFDVLCTGMKKLSYSDLRASMTLKTLGPLLFHTSLKKYGSFKKESDWFSNRSKGKGKLSFTEMSLLQRMYSLAHLGCSTTCIWDENANEYAMMRSLDWKAAKSICGATRIYRHYPHKTSIKPVYKSVGTLGMIGDLTVMKPGLCAAINYAPWPHPSISLGHDPTFKLRNMFENPKIETFSQAVEGVLNWKCSSPVFITLCGKEKGEACVIEIGYKNLKSVRYIEGPLLIQTNHYDTSSQSRFKNINAKMKGIKKLCEKPTFDGVTLEENHENWYISELMPNSMKRLSQLEKAFQDFSGNSNELERKLLEAYKKPPVFNYETIYWSLMRPNSEDLKVYRRQRT